MMLRRDSKDKTNLPHSRACAGSVAKNDRIVRVLLGAAFCGLGAYFHSWWGAVGLIPLVTGIVGWCPLYRLCGYAPGEGPRASA